MSKDTVSRITDRVIEEIQAWSSRPLEAVYAAVFVDAIMVKIRDGQVGNRLVYAAIGVEPATHLCAHCLEIPIAFAACAMAHPCSRTRATNSCRP